MIAFAIESVTEIIRAKLGNESDAEEKRQVYNQFNLAYIRDVNRLYRYHAQQLGNASVMSWRIYFEYIWWFGIHVPLYIGKWHLDVDYVKRYLEHGNKIDPFVHHVHRQLSRLVDQDANLGLLDCYRADQLLGDYSTLKHFDDFLENVKLEPRRTNILGCIKWTYFYVMVWYVLMQWKGFGIKGILSPQFFRYLWQLTGAVIYAAIGEQIYLHQTKHLPSNRKIAEKHQEFASYQYLPQLQPWVSAKQQAIMSDIKQEESTYTLIS
jgi:hypothetical protein